MVEEVKVSTTLDLKGLVCPIPVVKVSQAVKQLQVGEIRSPCYRPRRSGRYSGLVQDFR